MAFQEIALPQASGTTATIMERLHELVVTVDHKKLGLMYIGTALIFLVVSGSMAGIIRMQLAVPNNDLVSPQVFNRLFTMHGTAMVFLVGMPIIAGLMNYLVPLMIGARDMAFPRLNAFGYWMFLFGGPAALFQLSGRARLVGARLGAGCRLVRLRAAHRARFLAGPQHRLLDSRPVRQRHR